MDKNATLHDYVYKGVWKMENVPAYRAWIWTLKDSHALIVLGLFTLILTFTQRQAWSMLRGLVARRNRPVRLMDDTCSDPLQHVSQLEALKEIAWTFKYGVYKVKRSVLTRRLSTETGMGPLPLGSAAVSPYFGILALLNICAFITAGVAVPWLLSEGWQNTPIVRSKMLEDCVNSSRHHHIDTIVDEYPIVEAIFQPCNGRPGRGCEDDYYLKAPKIDKVRTRECPFNEQLCHRGVAPVRITHSNLTTFEAGINSKSMVNINRQVTCAPIISEPFIVPLKNRTESAISIHSQDRLERFNFYLLETKNGPNRFSNYSSGLKMARANGVNDVFILPIPIFKEHTRNEPLQIHPFLRRFDGMPFVIVWRGGPLGFIRGVVNDPFFSAHQKFRNYYVSDYEANTLGCVEQLQCCIPGLSKCSAWGTSTQQLAFLRDNFNTTKSPKERSDERALIKHNDLMRISEFLWSSFSIYDYIANRWIYDRLVPPLQRSVGASGKFDDRNEQWVVEVERWFMRALVGGILSVRNGMRWNTDNSLSTAPIEEKRRYTLCGRVLFRESGHTNINCLGFFVTIVALSLVVSAGSLKRVIARVFRSFKGLDTSKLSEAMDEFMNASRASNSDSITRYSWQRATGQLMNRFHATSRLIKHLMTLKKRRTPIDEPECIHITNLNSADTSNNATGQAWWEEIDGVI